ncbi:DNA cytosine methyltransferase [Knoellia sp. p5-6-4]|uniref:DNA cytosine methyltransferase n=1 Tax=unclassified Knoellia TaxID=2618719 RepID=UPI0023DA4B0C|nr:DNA cytosine methyltransferase [Knoellia sp. p5-6-4]MDF2144640.1 DNA cytosine methyltransferase [Knoellia sp. p5-6-4]
MAVAIDLFAGAGGFSLGVEMAGYTVTHALEIDAWACDTIRTNHSGTEVFQQDVTAVEDKWFLDHFPKNPDLMVGGPPCQGFSHAAVGRQDPKDPRNSLFRDFARAARVLEPSRVIMENVPGILRAKTSSGESVQHVIVEEFENLGYNVSVLVLNAHEFGVPQIRRRVFFVADSMATPPSAIPATHGESGPTIFGELKPFVTVREALGDLPLVDVGSRLDPVPYTSAPTNAYQAVMRDGAGEAVRNHMPMRHSQRLVERFKTIAPGQSQSHAPEEHAPRLRTRTESQGAGRFDQNNRRMHWDRPCHTVPATFYANFIHPELHRNFTPREGARIQSFPDRYVFEGKPTVVSQKLLAREGRVGEKHLCQYVQIGNAVPPLLAASLLRSLDANSTRTRDEESNVA